MKNSLNKYLIALSVLMLIASCKKEPDSPPVGQLLENSILTIDSLRDWQTSVNGTILIQDSLSVFGIVSMDEQNGNIYKNIYLQDDSAAINVRFTSATDLVQGDYIRISLIGATLSSYNGVIQLDGVESDTKVVIQSKKTSPTPLELTISEIDLSKHESKLIKLTNVQFKGTELLNTYADEINQTSENRLLEDFDGNTIPVRTSGFANFAGDSLPKGSGSIVCIVSEFNGSLQLILRSPEEALMNNVRGPGELLVKDFDDDDVFSGGWLIQQVVGLDTWEIGTAGGWPDKPYAVISNFDGSNNACESWLISPSINLTTSSAASLSFDNAYKYSGAPLKVMVSADYSGAGNPNLSTWAELTAIWSPGDFDFVNSGLIDLAAFLGSNIRVAFKYVGTDSDGRTWEIDNIKING